MKKLLSGLVAFTLFFAIGTMNAQAQCGKTEKKDMATVYAVKFHADDCKASQDLNASATKVSQDCGMKDKVKFVTFDFSTEDAKMKSKEMAKEMGIEDVYAEYKGKTGFVLLVDADSKKVLEKLTAKQSAEDMMAVVHKLAAN